MNTILLNTISDGKVVIRREGAESEPINNQDKTVNITRNGITEVVADDGKTRLYIRIAELGRMDVPLYFQQTISEGVTIDWGDGSATETLVGTGNVNTTHTYADKGDYVITLDVMEDCILGLGNGDQYYCVLGSIQSSAAVYPNMLQRAEIGKGVTDISDCAFKCCQSLSHIAITQDVLSIGNSAFFRCYSLASIMIPESVTSIGEYAFYQCYSLASVVLPQNITNISAAIFWECTSLPSIVIPKSVTSIGASSFNSCSSLTFVVIPQGVTSIGANAFSACSGMAIYDFRSLDNVPTLGNKAFNSIASDCKIVVPDALYEQWCSASNWSTYRSYIVKASEFNA